MWTRCFAKTAGKEAQRTLGREPKHNEEDVDGVSATNAAARPTKTKTVQSDGAKKKRTTNLRVATREPLLLNWSFLRSDGKPPLSSLRILPNPIVSLTMSPHQTHHPEHISLPQARAQSPTAPLLKQSPIPKSRTSVYMEYSLHPRLKPRKETWHGLPGRQKTKTDPPPL